MEHTIQPLVENGAANLREKMRALGGPTHRLAFAHSLIDQMVQLPTRPEHLKSSGPFAAPERNPLVRTSCCVSNRRSSIM